MAILTSGLHHQPNPSRSYHRILLIILVLNLHWQETSAKPITSGENSLLGKQQGAEPHEPLGGFGPNNYSGEDITWNLAENTFKVKKIEKPSPALMTKILRFCNLAALKSNHIKIFACYSILLLML